MLVKWMRGNQHIHDFWPGSVIFARIEKIIEDGEVDDDERKTLFETLVELTGTQRDDGNPATELPLDKPEPDVWFKGSSFCITGKLSFGPRANAEALIKSLGGTSKSNPSQGLDYLVIGELGSRDWFHSSFGGKIMRVVEWNEEKRKQAEQSGEDTDDYGLTKIISEETLIESAAKLAEGAK